MAKNKALEVFREYFPNITFSIRAKVAEEIVKIFEEGDQVGLEPSEELFFVLKYLEGELRLAKKKLTQTIKKYKRGECAIEEVQDHEFNVFEIEQDIEDIKEKIKWCGK